MGKSIFENVLGCGVIALVCLSEQTALLTLVDEDEESLTSE